MITLEPKKQIVHIRSILYNYQETHALIRRLYIQITRRPSSLMSGIIQPLLWLVLFGALFQNAPVSFFTENIEYNNFLSPGIIVFTAFTGSINAGLPLMFDREFGFLNRLLISPLTSRDSLFISSVNFITSITILQTLAILFVSSILLKNTYQLHELVQIFLVIFLVSLGIGSISICLAFILPGHIEFLAFTVIINLPMLFSSTALAPLSFMPHWLQIIASINPLTYAIESIRCLVTHIYLYQHTYYIRTIFFHLGFYENLCLLIIFNVVSFILAKGIISYKFE